LENFIVWPIVSRIISSSKQSERGSNLPDINSIWKTVNLTIRIVRDYFSNHLLTAMRAWIEISSKFDDLVERRPKISEILRDALRTNIWLEYNHNTGTNTTDHALDMQMMAISSKLTEKLSE
jgi:hypothetical protein